MTASDNDTTERTLGQLVADATRDISAIVKREVDLAKAEITADAKKAGEGAALFAIAAVFAFLALIMLLIAAAFGLVAAGVAPWAAFLIVAGVLIMIGVVCVLVARSAFGKVRGKPERAIKSTQDTIAVIKTGH
jgi:uncharacterized membrane protein